MKFRLLGAVTGALLAVGGAARATDVGPAYYAGFAQAGLLMAGDGMPHLVPSSGQHLDWLAVNGSSDAASASIDFGPTVLLTASAQGGSASAGADLIYQLKVEGPDPSVIVPIDYVITLTDSVVVPPSTAIGDNAPRGEAAAVFQIDGNNVVAEQCVNMFCGGANGVPYVHLDPGHYDLNVGRVIGIAEEVQAGAINGAAASASADPYFYIDPEFAAANPGYSILISPFVGNSPGGVPEPAAWAMILIGFGGLGTALRRSRRRPSMA